MSTDLNRKILDLLGVPKEDRYASHATLELHPNKLPQLTMHYDILSINSASSRPVATCHELHPVEAQEPEPFDLDKMVQAARQRLTTFLSRASFEAKSATAFEFSIAQQAMQDRWVLQDCVHTIIRGPGLQALVGGVWTGATPVGTPPDRWGRKHQGGNALPAALQIVAGVAGLAITLGWLGPRLDSGRTYSSYGYKPELAGEVAQAEAMARTRCARHEADNTGFIATADGGIVCTDKRGRRHPAGSRP